MCKSKYSDYCKDKCCDYKCKCGCDCDETKKALLDAMFHSSKARFSIEAIFEYKDPCDNIEVLLAFYEEAKENIEKLFCALEFLSQYYDVNCYYCGYESAYMIQRAIRDSEVAYTHLKEAKKLVDKYDCDCVICELFVLITVAFERIVRSEILIAAIAKVLKGFEEEDNCKKC